MPESHIGRSRGAILGAASMAPSNWPITPFSVSSDRLWRRPPFTVKFGPWLAIGTRGEVHYHAFREGTYINRYPKALIGDPWLVSKLLYKQREELHME
jgi:hypothetical protein